MARELDVRDFSNVRPSVGRRDKLNELAATTSSEVGLLGVSLPPFTVAEIDPTTDNPSVITFTLSDTGGGAGGGTSAGLEGGGASPPQDLVGRALEIVVSIGGVLGLAPGQPAEFDPDLNLQAATSGATAVHLEQQYKGIAIFQAAKAVRFAPDGQISALVGRTVTVADDLDTTPAITAEDAVRRAAEHVAQPDPDAPETDEFGTPIPAPQIDLEDFDPRVLATFLNRADQPTLFDSGPFHDQIRANLVWFQVDVDQLRLAWEIVLTLPGVVDQYRVIVDATSGDVLYVRQLIQSLRAVAAVFPINGGQPRQSLTLPVPVNTFGIPLPQGLPPGFPGDWVDAEFTAGNTTLARYGDTDRAFQGRTMNGTVVFEPAAPRSNDQAVVNAFFLSCLLHDFFYLLGFDEGSGNFQRVNAGRSGAAGDRVDVRVYPNEIPRTASMFTPVDGTSPILKLGLVGSTGNHTAMDATVVAHEYMHGVTNRLVGGPNNVSALDAPQSRGMGEGWGDWVGCTIAGASVVGAWLVNRPGGIRMFPYDNFPAQSDNFGQLGKGRYTAEHSIGEIWAATLMEINRRIGPLLALQLVVDALKLSPANPGFLEMRNAIFTALDFKARAGQISPAALPGIRDNLAQAFAKFGMGPRAASNGPFLAGIVADFTVPAGGGSGLEGDGGAGAAPEPVVVRVATPRRKTVPIPREAPGGAAVPLKVADGGTVRTVRVGLDVKHPSVGDLRVTLRSPRGTTAILHDQAGEGEELKREFSPADVTDLASFVGEPAAGDWSLTVEDRKRNADGRLRAWNLELELEPDPGAAPAPTEVKPSIPIPDNEPRGVDSTITLTGEGATGSIEVAVDITHPVPADLVIELIGPSGRAAVLQPEATAKEPNVARTFDSSTSDALRTLVGEPIAGPWRLRVADLVRKDTGTLNSWRLDVRPPSTGEGSGLTDDSGAPAAGAAPGLTVSEEGGEHDLRVAFHTPEAVAEFLQAFGGMLGAAGGGSGSGG